MIKAIVYILKHGFEAALVISLLMACLQQLGKTRLFRWVFWGTGLAAVLGAFIAYNMKIFGGRELFEGSVRAVGLILTAAFVIWIGSKPGKDPAEQSQQPVNGFGLPLKAYLLFTAFFLTVVPAVDIALFPKNIFIQTYNVINTELVLKFFGGFLGLLLCCLFGLAFLKITVKLSPQRMVAGTVVVGLLLILKQSVTLVQILFATAVLPLTPLVLSILIPFINNMDKFIYTFLAGAALWVVLAARAIKKGKAIPLGDLNPARRREIRAGVRREYRWLGAAAGLVILFASLTLIQDTYLNRPVQLSPAAPVTAKSDLIRVASASVNDRNLHRFGYTASDGTQVRFIIIRKSETAYGVGLDACEICGAAGYYQRKNQVVCRNCDVVMNIPTIGFPGGCNPIPLSYRMEGGSLVINAADLEKEKERFKQTGVFKNA